MDVNILVCSDIHASEEALALLKRHANPKEYDLMVFCGDFTTYGSVDFVTKFLKSMKNLKVLAVPGNCDFPQTVHVLEKAHASIHNRKVQFGGWHFFGFGGSIPTNAGMPFEVPEDEMTASLRKIASPGGVMITHMPPYGMNDKGRSGKHAGSQGILRVSQEFRPRLALSGHMHESRGMEMSDGVVYVNPGSARNGFYASVWLGKEIKVQFHEDEMAEPRSKIF